MMKTIPLCGLAAALALGPVPTVWADLQHTLERTFTVDLPGRVEVSLPHGDLRVTAGASDEVKLTVERLFRTDDQDEAEKMRERYDIDLQQEGDTISLDIDYDGPTWSILGIFGRESDLRVDVSVPAGTSFEGRSRGGDIVSRGIQGGQDLWSAGGDIDVSEFGGTSEFTTSGGDIDAAEGTGEIEARTSGGDIDLRGFSGQANLRTSGGDIEATMGEGSLVAKTTGGDVEVTITGAQPGPIELVTTGGDIDLAIDPTANLDVSAKTSGGDVRTRLPLTIQGRIGQGSLEGTLNGGGPPARLRTTGGDITLVARDSTS